MKNGLFAAILIFSIQSMALDIESDCDLATQKASWEAYNCVYENECTMNESTSQFLSGYFSLLANKSEGLSCDQYKEAFESIVRIGKLSK